jgi:histidinol-phosphate aminotransferase
VVQVYPSEANFLLVKFINAIQVFEHLKAEFIIVRDRSKVVPNCLRITVGTQEENEKLIQALKKIVQ